MQYNTRYAWKQTTATQHTDTPKNVNAVGEANRMRRVWSLPEAAIKRTVSELDPATIYYVSNFSVSPGQGNQMFQYASLYALAQQNNATLLIPEKVLIRRSFGLNGSQIVSRKLANDLGLKWKRIVYKDCCRFYPWSPEADILSSHTYTGYMQSWRYFHPKFQENVREQFQFLDPVKNVAKDYLHRALKIQAMNVSERVLIGVHVRRGEDLRLSIQNIEHGHTVAPLSYITNAMRHFRNKFPNALFIVCSDQPRWCKAHLDDDDDVIVMNTGQREVDMCILTMCEHTVMTVGTFSWWAAYLTGGTTVYYDGWPKPSTRLDNMLNKTEFFLPSWIPMGK